MTFPAFAMPRDIVFRPWVVGEKIGEREVHVDMGNPDMKRRPEGSRPYANGLPSCQGLPISPSDDIPRRDHDDEGRRSRQFFVSRKPFCMILWYAAGLLG